MASQEYLGPMDGDGNSLIRLAIEDYYRNRLDEARRLTNDIFDAKRSRIHIYSADELCRFIEEMDPIEVFEAGVATGHSIEDGKLYEANGMDAGFWIIPNPREYMIDVISGNWKDIVRGKYVVPARLRESIDRLMAQPRTAASNNRKSGTAPKKKAPAKKATSRRY